MTQRKIAYPRKLLRAGNVYRVEEEEDLRNGTSERSTSGQRAVHRKTISYFVSLFQSQTISNFLLFFLYRSIFYLFFFLADYRY